MIDKVEISNLALTALANVQTNGQLELPLDQGPSFQCFTKSGEVDGMPVSVVCPPEEAVNTSLFRALKVSEIPGFPMNHMIPSGVIAVEEREANPTQTRRDYFLLYSNNIYQLIRINPNGGMDLLGTSGLPFPKPHRATELYQIIEAFQKKNIYPSP